MRILICPDSFKLSASARQVAEALERGGKSAAKRLGIPLETRLAPLSDGGEGFLDTISAVRPVERRVALCPHVDLGSGLRNAAWLFDPQTNTAFGETAEVVGLGVSRTSAPETRTAVGVGTYVGTMARCGVEKIILGVGGTATVDGGASVAYGLGARFFRGGHQIPVSHANDANRAEQIVLPTVSTPPAVECWCDVETTLAGERGAVATFAPQKGASPSWVETETAAVAPWAAKMEDQFGVHANAPGTGAGGGIPFGLSLAMPVRIRRGAEAMCALLRLDEAVAWADWVWTGEGQVDATTAEGKLLSAVRTLCNERGKPLTVFAGQVEPGCREDWPDVCFVPLVAPSTSLEESLENPERFLEIRASHHLEESSSRDGG